MYLILQYHEPNLCAFLYSRKINTFDFSYSHFSTLFAKTVKKEILYMIWDKYFEKVLFF